MSEGNILIIEYDKRNSLYICKIFELNKLCRKYIIINSEIVHSINTENIYLLMLDRMIPYNGSIYLYNTNCGTNLFPILIAIQETIHKYEVKKSKIRHNIGTYKIITSLRCIKIEQKFLEHLQPSQKNESSVIKLGDIQFDAISQYICSENDYIRLTKSESVILQCLTNKPNQVFSRKILIENIHGRYTLEYERNVDTHIKNLRKKLARATPGKLYIETIYGKGYRLSLSSNSVEDIK